MTATAVILPPGEVLGGFRIGDVIGVGGMAVVYRARQISLNREVALKVLSPEYGRDEVFVERFRREGMHVARLDHPNVIPIFDAGEDKGRLFLAMRFVEGMTLAERIRVKPLTAEETLQLLKPVADGLDVAHSIGLVHRDIKPQNILVTGEGHPYLADFGVAKGVDSAELTASGGFIGTLHYAAPEQLLGTATVPATDIYALSAVLYHCLSGTVPYPYDTQARVIAAQLNQPPPQLNLPGAEDVSKVIARGMAKDPEARYPSAAELIGAAERAVHGLPPSYLGQRPAFGHGPTDAALSSLATIPEGGSAPKRRRIPRIGPRPAAALAAGVVIAAGTLTAISLAEGTATASTHLIRSGPLAIDYTRPWTTPRHAFGASLLSAASWAGGAAPIQLGSGSTTMSAGALAKPAALPGGPPPRLVSLLGVPGRTLTRLRDGGAAIYSWNSSAGRDVSAWVIPTVRGDLAIICSVPLGSTSSMRTCEKMATHVRLEGLQLMAVGRDTSLARSLQGIVGHSPRNRHPLAGMYSGGAGEPAAAPRRLARTDSRIVSELNKLVVPPRYGSTVSGLRTAFRAEGSALASLAVAAVKDDGRAYARASRAIARADRELASLGRAARRDGLLKVGLVRVSVPHLPVRTTSTVSSPSVSSTPSASPSTSTPSTSGSSPASTSTAARGSNSGTTTSSSSQTGQSGPIH